jgi:hypothetical protein
MGRRGAAFAALVAGALSAAASPARAEEPWQRRGLMRGGMSLATAGMSSSISSVAVLASTEGRVGLPAMGMALAGQALLAVGVPMWAVGAPGRETRPGNAPLLYAGLALAGVGLIGLPVSTGLLAASLDPEIDDEAPLLIAGAVTAGAANLLLVAGIPMWAIGARSPDDRFLGLQLGPVSALTGAF